jgi:hypothetical protein
MMTMLIGSLNSRPIQYLPPYHPLGDTLMRVYIFINDVTV